MENPHKSDRLLSFITSYFEYEENDLVEETCLVEKFNDEDPEEFCYFLEELSKEFRIEVPGWGSHRIDKDKLGQASFFQWLGQVFDRENRPAVHVNSLKIQKLREIISNGRWPESWVRQDCS